MEKIKQFLSSYTATIILLLIYAVTLALATFIEKQYGTVAAKIFVYYSPVFFLLQFLLVLNFIFALMKYQYLKHRRWALLTVHMAFVVILAGAFITHVFGKEGQVHIREGEKTDRMTVHTQRGMSVEKLPFTLELTDFRLNRYPGSASPSSYESDLKVHLDNEVREANVYMNNVLDVKGYRFFQASFDEDELGTILSVNQDVAGRTVTYFGYFLLMVGFLLVFIDKRSRFRKLAQQLKEVRNASGHVAVVLFLLLLSCVVSAQSTSGKRMMEVVQQTVVSPEHAAKFGALPVQSGGRVMPLNTFSSEILRKIHKDDTFGNLNSDQFLLSFLAMPQMWTQVPFISVSNTQIRERYQLPENYFAYEHVFDSHGNYRLLAELQQIYHKPPAERNAADKDLIKIDEQINILFQLLNKERISIFPDASHPNHTWYAPGDDLSALALQDSLLVTELFPAYLSEVTRSMQSGNWEKPDELLEEINHFQRSNDAAFLIHPKKLEAELRYNQWNIFNAAKQWYLILGALLLILTFMQLMQAREWRNRFIPVFIIGIAAIFLYQTFGMGLRWYISGYAPWSNSYETMVYVAWATVLAGFIFGRKSHITMALATIFGGVILFVSGLNWMDPQISPLVPVLKSPWLMFHVAVIVAAYGFFGISFLLGATNLSIIAFTKKSEKSTYRIKELSIINSMSLMVGLALMTIGTFLGAIWANESWGRYWGWDPKETWALITVVVYTVVTHLHLVKKWSGDWLFNLLSVFAFASVLMTFLGVNYLLSGMHSYGQTDGISAVFLYIALAFIAVGILGFISFRKRQHTVNSELTTMIHWGFIGCGSVTEKKSGPAFNKVVGSKVVAVMRRDGEKAKNYARRHGIGKWYDNAEDLINDPEVTAVYVATPPGSHAEYAIAAMRAGKPVYVEKPMAATYEECVAMQRVSEETGVPCFVAYYRRTLPYFLRVKQLINDGALGEVSTVQIRFALPPRDEDLHPETLPWRVKKELAGAGYFYDLASHQLDLLDFLLGEITQAEGFSTNIGGLYDVEDTVGGAFRFQSGALGSGSWSFVAPKDSRTDMIDFVGTKGKLTCSTFGFTPIVLETSEGTQEFMEQNPENIQFYLIQSIVNYLNGNGEMPVSTCRSAARTNWAMEQMVGERSGG